MMKRSFVRAGAIGSVALGLLAGLTAGCANDTSGKPSSSGYEKTAIASSAMSVNGCQAVGTFDITSPEVIDFIALDKSDLQSAQMQLYTVDDQGRQTQVQQTAQEADSSMQALLDSTTDNINAAQAESSQQSQRQVQNNSSTSTAAHEADQTTVSASDMSAATGDMSASHTDSHNDSHAASASNSASQSGSASNSALAEGNAQNSANQNASANRSADSSSRSSGANGAQNAASQSAQLSAAENGLLPVASTCIVGDPVVASCGSLGPFSFSSDTQQASGSNASNSAFNKAAAEQSANEAANQASGQNAASNFFNFTQGSQAAQNATNQASSESVANHVDNASTDASHTATSKSDQATQTIAHQADSSNAMNAQNGALESNSSSASSSNRNEASAANHYAQSNQAKSQSNTLVYNDLSTLNSHHLLLVINMTSSQAQSLIRLFEGSNGQIGAVQSFPIDTSSCGVTLGLEQPVIQPVTIDPPKETVKQQG